MYACSLARLLALYSVSLFLSTQFPTPYLKNGASQDGLGISASINLVKAIPHRST